MRTNVLCFLIGILTLGVAEQGSAQVFTWRRSLISGTNTIGVNPLNPNSILSPGTNGYLFVSYNKGTTWTQRAPLPNTSDVRQILVHPSDTMTVFLVGFSGGLRRSTDYGMTWSVALASFGIDGESIAYDPRRPDTMYAGNFTGARVYRSTDRGLTWTFISSAGPDICALTVRPDSGNILFAGTGGGTISKSTDFGATWRQVKGSGSAEIPKIVFNRNNPMIAYGAAYSGPDSTIGIWKTTDGGEHWILTSLRGISVWALDISRSNPEVLYTGTFSDAHSAVYRTTNGGGTWDTLKSGYPPGGNAWSLKVDPLDPGTVWLAVNGTTRNGIYRWVSMRGRVQGTVRDAATNQPATAGSVRLLSTGETVPLDQSGHYSFDYFDGDSTLSPVVHVEAYPYFLHDEQITFMLDSTTTHDILLQRLPSASITGSVKSTVTGQPLQAVVTAFANSIGGVYGQSAMTGSSGMFQLNNLYVTYPPIVWYDSLYVDPVFPFRQTLVRSIQLDPAGLSFQFGADTADVLVVSTTQVEDSLGHNAFQGFYREALDSLGLTAHIWQRNFGRGYAPGQTAREVRKKTAIFYTGSDTLSLFPAEHDSLVAAMNAGVHVFMTGQNFVERNDSLARGFFGVHHGGNTTQIFVKGAAGDLFNNMSFGTNGSNSANNQNSRDILLIDSPHTHSMLSYGFLGGLGTAGVRVDSVGGGGKLLLFGFGFEAINSPTLRKTIMGQIIGYFEGSIVLDVQRTTPQAPAAYSLEQNYPNPFNPATTINFSLSSFGFATLKVYDIEGKEVVTLVNGSLSPGKHQAILNGRNLSSGIYFYRLVVHSMQGGELFLRTRKLVLVK